MNHQRLDAPHSMVPGMWTGVSLQHTQAHSHLAALTVSMSPNQQCSQSPRAASHWPDKVRCLSVTKSLQADHCGWRGRRLSRARPQCTRHDCKHRLGTAMPEGQSMEMEERHPKGKSGDSAKRKEVSW